MLRVVICPGVNPPELTQSFCREVQAVWPIDRSPPVFWVVPPTVPPFSPCHQWNWLRHQLRAEGWGDGGDWTGSQKNSVKAVGQRTASREKASREKASRSAGILPPLVPRSSPPLPRLTWIAFSAGVVGALGCAQGWRWRGGTVQGLYALDGWGMPVLGDFPVYRLSHDRFTHVTSAWLGTGRVSFYADPPVTHWDLWRSPAQVMGWQVSQGKQRQTAAEFIVAQLLLY